MKCPKCGTEFDEGIFCPECGTKVITAMEPETEDSMREKESDAKIIKQEAEIEVQKQREEVERLKREKSLAEEKAQKASEKIEKEKQNAGKRKATLSLIFGIISILSLGLSVVPEILGIVFAFKGKEDGKMLGKAKAGLICSVISAVALIIMIVAAALDSSAPQAETSAAETVAETTIAATTAPTETTTVAVETTAQATTEAQIVAEQADGDSAESEFVMISPIFVDGLAEDIQERFNQDITVYTHEDSEYLYDNNNHVYYVPAEQVRDGYYSKEDLVAEWAYQKVNGQLSDEVKSNFMDIYSSYGSYMYWPSLQESDDHQRITDIYSAYFYYKTRLGEVSSLYEEFIDETQPYITIINDTIRGKVSELEYEEPEDNYVPDTSVAIVPSGETPKGDPAEVVEKYMKAISKWDIDAANKLVCDEGKHLHFDDVYKSEKKLIKRYKKEAKNLKGYVEEPEIEGNEAYVTIFVEYNNATNIVEIGAQDWFAEMLVSNKNYSDEKSANMLMDSIDEFWDQMSPQGDEKFITFRLVPQNGEWMIDTTPEDVLTVMTCNVYKAIAAVQSNLEYNGF